MHWPRLGRIDDSIQVLWRVMHSWLVAYHQSFSFKCKWRRNDMNHSIVWNSSRTLCHCEGSSFSISAHQVSAWVINLQFTFTTQVAKWSSKLNLFACLKLSTLNGGEKVRFACDMDPEKLKEVSFMSLSCAIITADKRCFWLLDVGLVPCLLTDWQCFWVACPRWRILELCVWSCIWDLAILWGVRLLPPHPYPLPIECILVLLLIMSW